MQARVFSMEFAIEGYLAAATLAVLHPAPPAFARPIPNAQACTVGYALTGEPVQVQQVRGPTPYLAAATYSPHGVPVIIYGSGYFSIPPFMQTWVSTHECGHLALRTLSEFQANCYALRQLRPNASMLERVASYHRSMGRLSPQYGGDGAAFWRGTLSVCER